ncbi:hypothetical protein BLNAU_7947 [Blattamonas nauphoetae]|uniref:Uncharacterized protein n=1 Tax=Blattamonas nauphoetae TaxID=2049346 RepID=A0ABQ9Y057_9EUKA|nr:hypothetical protein BLNAU_7947 [Blattamonas nauphoetae]
MRRIWLSTTQMRKPLKHTSKNFGKTQATPKPLIFNLELLVLIPLPTTKVSPAASPTPTSSRQPSTPTRANMQIPKCRRGNHPASLMGSRTPLRMGRIRPTSTDNHQLRVLPLHSPIRSSTHSHQTRSAHPTLSSGSRTSLLLRDSISSRQEDSINPHRRALRIRRLRRKGSSLCRKTGSISHPRKDSSTRQPRKEDSISNPRKEGSTRQLHRGHTLPARTDSLTRNNQQDRRPSMGSTTTTTRFLPLNRKTHHVHQLHTPIPPDGAQCTPSNPTTATVLPNHPVLHRRLPSLERRTKRPKRHQAQNLLRL